MTSRFTPVAAPPSPQTQLFPTPIQVVPPLAGVVRSGQTAVELQHGFGTPEGRAWAMLLLRAAYLDDFQFSVTAAGYHDGLVHAERLAGEPFGEYRITALEYSRSILCVLHGVRNATSINQVALDLTVPRYTQGATQFLQTAGVVGDSLLAAMSAGRWSAKPKAYLGHSFGGVIGAYCQAKPNFEPAPIGLQTFGTPKIGQENASDPLLNAPTFVYGAQDDPIIGLPPSYIRLQLVAVLLALWPVAAGAARNVKARIDGIWSSLHSIDSRPGAIDDSGAVTEMANVDIGQNWYARNPAGEGNLFDIRSFETTPGHQAPTYYRRCRAAFNHWTTLNASAGPAGRDADLLALAILAAEQAQE